VRGFLFLKKMMMNIFLLLYLLLLLSFPREADRTKGWWKSYVQFVWANVQAAGKTQCTHVCTKIYKSDKSLIVGNNLSVEQICPMRRSMSFSRSWKHLQATPLPSLLSLEERQDPGWCLACEHPPFLEGWVLAQILLPQEGRLLRQAGQLCVLLYRPRFD